MKYRITYKEITVAIGILVAAVVILTLWVRTPQEQAVANTIKLPSIKMTLPKLVIRSVTGI